MFKKEDRTRIAGRFANEETPPARRVELYLPEPFLEALAAYGEEHGLSRSKSILKLLEGRLEQPSKPDPLPAAKKELVSLEQVERTNPLYRQFRSRHYIPDRGLVGQQLLYLIFYGNEVVGVIGGASAVFTTQARNEFWGLSEEKDVMTRQLNSVVNNCIFRLEYPAPNLATIVLSMWRKRIAKDWEHQYGVSVAGFETFVVEERLWNGKTRNGACYRADNWEMVGITRGYGDTNVRGRKHNNKALKAKKLIYCKRIAGVELCTDYTSSWNDKERTKELSKRRKEMLPDELDLVLKTLR